MQSLKRFRSVWLSRLCLFLLVVSSVISIPVLSKAASSYSGTVTVSSSVYNYYPSYYSYDYNASGLIQKHVVQQADGYTSWTDGGVNTWSWGDIEFHRRNTNGSTDPNAVYEGDYRPFIQSGGINPYYLENGYLYARVAEGSFTGASQRGEYLLNIKPNFNTEAVITEEAIDTSSIGTLSRRVTANFIGYYVGDRLFSSDLSFDDMELLTPGANQSGSNTFTVKKEFDGGFRFGIYAVYAYTFYYLYTVRDVAPSKEFISFPNDKIELRFTVNGTSSVTAYPYEGQTFDKTINTGSWTFNSAGIAAWTPGTTTVNDSEAGLIARLISSVNTLPKFIIEGFLGRAFSLNYNYATFDSDGVYSSGNTNKETNESGFANELLKRVGNIPLYIKNAINGRNFSIDYNYATFDGDGNYSSAVTTKDAKESGVVNELLKRIGNLPLYIRNALVKAKTHVTIQGGEYQVQDDGSTIYVPNSTETDETTGGFLARIINGILGLPKKIIDGIVGLFVPSDDTFQDFVDGLRQSLSNNLGFIGDILNIFATLVSVLMTNASNPHLIFPGFSMMGYEIWPQYDYYLNSNSLMVTVAGYAKTGISVILVGAFIAYVTRWYERKFRT